MALFTGSDPTDMSPLASVHLGDVITLGDRPPLTVRSRVLLPSPVGQMAGFVVAGELEVVVSFAAIDGAPFVVYQRVGRRPPSGIRARAAFSGATNYWAPHLPAARSAMGEILWRVADVAGSLDPIVVLWRSGEPAVFLRDGELAADQLGVKWMPRDRPDDRQFVRESSRVSAPVFTPEHIPAPSRERVPTGHR